MVVKKYIISIVTQERHGSNLLFISISIILRVLSAQI